MATLVITIVTPDSVADVTDRLILDGGSPHTITESPLAQDRVARFVDGVANAAYNQTSFTVAVS
jgi:hypothetical protein